MWSKTKLVGVLIGKGLCYFEGHKVERWTYRRGPPCIQYGVCQRCGASRARLHHHWVEHTCKRCGEHQPPRI